MVHVSPLNEIGFPMMLGSALKRLFQNGEPGS